MTDRPVSTGKVLLGRLVVICGFMAIALVALVLVGRALFLSEQVTFAAGNRVYHVPSVSVLSHREQPHLFVRFRPGHGPFEIVYDAALQGHFDGRGHPAVFSIDAGGSHDVAYLKQGTHTVVCRRASAPAGGCGAALQHAGASWSVLFPEARAPDIQELMGSAAKLLDSYAASH